jgi:hypothetical protein
MQRPAVVTASCFSSLVGLLVSSTTALAQTPPPPSQPPPYAQQQPYPQQQGYQQQPYPQQQGYQQQPYPQQQGYQHEGSYEPPPPPRRRDPDDEGGSFPDFSVRVDPLHWLIAGRLPLELEVQPLKALRFLTVQVVPMFVTWSSPPALNLQGREDNLTQHSNGLGPISGASFGVGFWLSGKPLQGYVLRASYSNYSYEYKTRDAEGDPLDQVTYVERRVLGEIGSYSRYGAFILGGTLQIGAELNDKSRCIRFTNTGFEEDNTQKCEDLQIVIDDSPQDEQALNLRSPLHPVVLDFTFTLGVAF